MEDVRPTLDLLGWEDFSILVIPCTSEAAYHRRYQERDKVNDDGSEINWPIPFWYMDIGCAVMILLLAVVEEGLGAGFVGLPEIENFATLRSLLGIPEEVTPVGVIPIGHREAGQLQSLF